MFPCHGWSKKLRDQKIKMANDIPNLLMEEIPNLPKESISVIFYDNPAENWIVGGVTEIL